jgi:hypothetical protein
VSDFDRFREVVNFSSAMAAALRFLHLSSVMSGIFGNSSESKTGTKFSALFFEDVLHPAQIAAKNY